MARITQITEREQVAEEHQTIFDSIAESRGRVSGPFSVLLNSPEIAGRAAHLGAYIRFDSTLEPQQRELAIITAARMADCQYEWSAHAPMAERAGVRDEAIDAVVNKAPVGGLTEEEALIITYARELLGANRVSEQTFYDARTMFGDQGVTELTATLGYYTMLACALNAFEVEPPDGTPRLR
ncbi:MAG: carboxymuconolactone decarboxylase family protein [SAR202 cluster bacterium]|nr:carboxymuconolactone decarboxylase family protein [SAR202 cluster bacterium]|tara:strand:+ start:3088 stop:3633 length:546 start_codon:yes stop_codon:yes gene_type:complete